MSKLKTIIGVDPGVHTGIAVYDCQSKSFTKVKSLSWWDAYWFIVEYNRDSCLIAIENSSTQKRIWQRGGGKTARVMGAIGRSIGQNNADAKRLQSGLERKCFRVVSVKPKHTKMSAVQVKALTGCKLRTNEHNRDAIMIVWRLRGVADHLFARQFKIERVL